MVTDTDPGQDQDLETEEVVVGDLDQDQEIETEGIAEDVINLKTVLFMAFTDQMC